MTLYQSLALTVLEMCNAAFFIVDNLNGICLYIL